MKKKVILGFLSLVLSLGAFAQMPSMSNSGEWCADGTWVFGGIPNASSTASISNGTEVTVSCEATCGTLRIQGILTINASGNLVVNNNLTMASSSDNVPGLVNNGNLTVDTIKATRGTLTFGAESTTTADVFTISGATVDVNGTIITDSISVTAGIADFTGATIQPKTEGAEVVYNISEGATVIGLPEPEEPAVFHTVMGDLVWSGNCTDNGSSDSYLIWNGGSLTVDVDNATCGNIYVRGSLTVTDGSSLIADTIETNSSSANVTLDGTVQVDEIVITKGTITFAEGVVLTNKAGTGTPNIVIGENATVSYLPANVTVTYQRSIAANKWTFVGLPHAENIQPLTTLGTDNVWALAFNYQSYDWDTEYLHVWDNGTADDLTDDQYDGVQRGHGIFVFSEVAAKLNILSSYITGVESVSMPSNAAAKTAQEGRWFALSNPNNTPLDIANFLSANSNNVNGGVVYTYSGTSFGAGEEEGTIAVGEGFFVNMQDSKSTVTFQTGAKATSNPKEYITLSVSTDGYKEAVKFAINDEASTSYDRFDANKMFGNGTVAEPYLVCEGINLCKEVVDILPYTATMNVRSGEARSVEISADRIPEAYTLVLVDGAQEIELSEGDVYETTLAEGENADRFSLKIGKSAVSIQDVAKAEELSIRNNNRIITVNGGNNISVEVYNALGQKVYETNQRTFELNGVAAGAYVVKAKSEGVAHSSKIVVR